MKNYHLFFEYDKTGRGKLVLHNDSMILYSGDARTGSVNKKGKLVNAIKPGNWYITQAPVYTEELGMVITPGMGWKVRLYLQTDNGYIETHYLIHPDGNKPGSKGCVVLVASDGQELKEKITHILLEHNPILVMIKEVV